MKRNEQQLTERISRLREAIKRKYKLFKQGIVESDSQLEQQFKPLLTELRKIPKSENMSFKEEIPDEQVESDEEFDFKPETYSSPHPTRTSLNEDTLKDVSAAVSTDEGLETASQYVNEQFNHDLTKNYMLKLMRDAGGKARIIDHTYGPRFEKDVLMVGSKPIRFDNDGSIIISDTRYKPTHGLYELLFKRLPDDEIYDKEDLKAYKDILNKTSAHKKNYKFRGIINRDQSIKYKHIISQLFPKPPISGKGLFLTKNSSQPDILFWDDPNELVERLRLLVVSAETGNTGHKNEIISILEELKEAGIIKGKPNKKLISLLK